MFGTFRKHSQPLWIAIIIVVVISFVVFFTPGFDPFDSGGTITADAAAVERARDQVLIDNALGQIINWPRQRQMLAQQLFQAGRMEEANKLIQTPPPYPQLNAQRMAGDSRQIDLNGDNYDDINSLEYRARIRL